MVTVLWGFQREWSRRFIGLLVVLSVAFAGPVGVVLFATATLVGLVPVRLRTRRVYCMGVLLVPLAL